MGEAGAVLLLGIVGAGLFYGDAMITPAISVLSAVEGLKLVDARPRRLCRADHAGDPDRALRRPEPRDGQGRGLLRPDHGRSGSSALAVTGSCTSRTTRRCSLAINPAYGVMFFVNHPGVVARRPRRGCLSVTGAEALYADLGHFGRGPIRAAWLGFVFPALVINYFGQGALVLSDPGSVEHPLFRLVPEWALLPMCCLPPARPSSRARPSSPAPSP